MKFSSASAPHRERFRALLPEADDLRVQPMFGHVAALVNGNMAAGTWADGALTLKLSRADQVELSAAGGVPFDPMAGRPMRDTLVAPAAVVADDDVARTWVHRAVAYTRTLPPKAKKPKR